MSIPENPDGEDLAVLVAGLTGTVRDNNDLVKRAVDGLADEKRWQRRFALGTTVSGLLLAAAVSVIITLLGSLHGTQGRLASVVACNDNRSRQFVNAVAARAVISNEENAALGKLLSEVLHVTTSKDFTKDVNTYISDAAKLRAQPVPAYPASACQ